MDKLRLLLFSNCHKSCDGCCNNDFDLDSLEIETDFSGYSEVILTGGEPMLFPQKVKEVAVEVRKQTGAPIYLYTTLARIPDLVMILQHIQGITFTLHDQEDVQALEEFYFFYERVNDMPPFVGQSIRVNIFEGIKAPTFDEWDVRSGYKWVKNCPLPEDEVFKKLAESHVLVPS